MKTTSTKTASNPTNRFYQELFSPLKNECHKALFHYYLLCLSPTYYKKVAKSGDIQQTTEEAYQYMKATFETYLKARLEAVNKSERIQKAGVQFDWKHLRDRNELYCIKVKQHIKHFIKQITGQEYYALPEIDAIERHGRNHVQAWSYYLRSMSASEALVWFGDEIYETYPSAVMKNMVFSADHLAVKEMRDLISKSVNDSFVGTLLLDQFQHFHAILIDIPPRQTQDFYFDLRISYKENLKEFDKYLQKKLSRSVYSVSKEKLEDDLGNDLESMELLEFQDTKTKLQVIWIDTGTAYIESDKLKGGTCGQIFSAHTSRDDDAIFLMCFLKKPDKEIYTPIIWASYLPNYRVIAECRGVANNMIEEHYHQYLIPLFELQMKEVYRNWPKGDLEKKPYFLNAVLELYYHSPDTNVDMINPHQMEPHVLKKILEIRPDLISNKMIEYYKDEMNEIITLEDFVNHTLNLDGRDSPRKDWVIDVLKGEHMDTYNDAIESEFEQFMSNLLDQKGGAFENVEVTWSDFKEAMSEELEEFHGKYQGNYHNAWDGAYNDEVYKKVKKDLESWIEDNLKVETVEWEYDPETAIRLSFAFSKKVNDLKSLRQYLVGMSRWINMGDVNEMEVDTNPFYVHNLDYIYADEEDIINHLKEMIDYKQFIKELNEIGKKYLKEIGA